MGGISKIVKRFKDFKKGYENYKKQLSNGIELPRGMDYIETDNGIPKNIHDSYEKQLNDFAQEYVKDLLQSTKSLQNVKGVELIPIKDIDEDGNVIDKIKIHIPAQDGGVKGTRIEEQNIEVDMTETLMLFENVDPLKSRPENGYIDDAIQYVIPITEKIVELDEKLQNENFYESPSGSFSPMASFNKVEKDLILKEIAGIEPNNEVSAINKKKALAIAYANGIKAENGREQKFDLAAGYKAKYDEIDQSIEEEKDKIVEENRTQVVNIDGKERVIPTIDILVARDVERTRNANKKLGRHEKIKNIVEENPALQYMYSKEGRRLSFSEIADFAEDRYSQIENNNVLTLEHKKEQINAVKRMASFALLKSLQDFHEPEDIEMLAQELGPERTKAIFKEIVARKMITEVKSKELIEAKKLLNNPKYEMYFYSDDEKIKDRFDKFKNAVEADIIEPFTKEEEEMERNKKDIIDNVNNIIEESGVFNRVGNYTQKQKEDNRKKYYGDKTKFSARLAQIFSHNTKNVDDHSVDNSQTTTNKTKTVGNIDKSKHKTVTQGDKNRTTTKTYGDIHKDVHKTVDKSKTINNTTNNNIYVQPEQVRNVNSDPTIIPESTPAIEVPEKETSAIEAQVAETSEMNKETNNVTEKNVEDVAFESNEANNDSENNVISENEEPKQQEQQSQQGQTIYNQTINITGDGNSLEIDNSNGKTEQTIEQKAEGDIVNGGQEINVSNAVENIVADVKAVAATNYLTREWLLSYMEGRIDGYTDKLWEDEEEAKRQAEEELSKVLASIEDVNKRAELEAKGFAEIENKYNARIEEIKKVERELTTLKNEYAQTGRLLPAKSLEEQRAELQEKLQEKENNNQILNSIPKDELQQVESEQEKIGAVEVSPKRIEEHQKEDAEDGYER